MRPVIHFIDFAPDDEELRPVCGSRNELVAWTTVRTLVSCASCARLLRAERAGVTSPPPPLVRPAPSLQPGR